MGAVISRSLFISARKHGMLLSVFHFPASERERESRPKTRARPTLIRTRARVHASPFETSLAVGLSGFGSAPAAVFQARWSEQ